MMTNLFRNNKLLLNFLKKLKVLGETSFVVIFLSAIVAFILTILISVIMSLVLHFNGFDQYIIDMIVISYTMFFLVLLCVFNKVFIYTIRPDRWLLKYFGHMLVLRFEERISYNEIKSIENTLKDNGIRYFCLYVNDFVGQIRTDTTRLSNNHNHNNDRWPKKQEIMIYFWSYNHVIATKILYPNEVVDDVEIP